MMDMIDADWIQRHLTNRHGELAELSRATGIAADKISKILKGERRVSAAEAVTIHSYFSLIPSGFAESPVSYSTAQASTVPLDHILARALAPNVRRPMAYQISTAIHALHLAAGDVVMIDTDQASAAAGIVVANILDAAQTTAATQLRRAFDGMLIATDPTDPEPVIRADQAGRCGIIGTVVASYRRDA